MLVCKQCNKNILPGQVFAEVNMTKLLKCNQDELSMEHVYDDEECILHKECFTYMLTGVEPDPQVQVAEQLVERTDPLEFFA